MSGMLLHIKQIKINIIVFKPRIITNYGKFRDRYAVAYVWVQSTSQHHKCSIRL